MHFAGNKLTQKIIIMKDKLFQVNLEGLLDVLSNHLYSSEKVYIRELLQNACDAVKAREILGDDFAPAITVQLYEADSHSRAQLVVEDNGIGLSEDEVVQFLSSIGSSTKREHISSQRETFIGQFGVGLLSCFMVSDAITLITKSANSDFAIEWVGKTDGTYNMNKLEGEYKTGTKVFLSCKDGKEKFFERKFIEKHIAAYGELLSYPISFGEEDRFKRMNNGIAVWEKEYLSDQEKRESILEYGIKTFEMEFYDFIELKSKNGDVGGIAYILPYVVKPSVKTSHKVFLKRMLISDQIADILPDWAFFVKCIINTDKLKPTASRERLYHNDDFDITKEELGLCIKNHLVYLSKFSPERLMHILNIHNNSIKSLAIQDDDFFKMIINWISFPSTIGNITLEEYSKTSRTIKHIPDVDQFRQIAPVAISRNILILNSGYVYDAYLLGKLNTVDIGLNVEEIDANSFIEIFEDLTIDEREEVVGFTHKADSIMLAFKCRVEVKKFSPENLPALFYMSSDANFSREIEKSKEEANDLWGDILGGFQEENEAAYSQLCLNYSNPLVKKIISIVDNKLLESLIQILYVNSMLMGHYPLSSVEMKILNTKLLNIVELGLRDY